MEIKLGTFSHFMSIHGLVPKKIKLTFWNFPSRRACVGWYLQDGIVAMQQIDIGTVRELSPSADAVYPDIHNYVVVVISNALQLSLVVLVLSHLQAQKSRMNRS